MATKKRKRKINKTLAFTFGLLMVWISILFIQKIEANTYKVHVDVAEEAKVNTPTTFSFTITKKGREYSATNVKIHINHTYDKAYQINTEIKPYETGKYELIITPKNSGTYKWMITFDESDDVFEGEFTI